MKFKLSEITGSYGKIARPCEEAFEFEGSWVIEFKNLEELEQYCRKNGSLILKKPQNNTDLIQLRFLWD